MRINLLAERFDWNTDDWNAYYDRPNSMVAEITGSCRIVLVVKDSKLECPTYFRKVGDWRTS